MIIKLPFEYYVNLQNNFSLEDLIIACYNVKSHKFNYWYELFCDTLIDVENDKINILLNFDHGS